MAARGRALSIALAGLILAGCETTAELASSGGPVAIALEGFVGVPAPVGDRVASELARAAPSRRFVLVPPGDARARYVMRGYLAPAEGGAVSYVWDLFDRSGQRAQRLSGDVRTGGGADAWVALAGPGAAPLAAESAAAIERFLADPRPAATAADVAAPPIQVPAPVIDAPRAPALAPGAGRRVSVGSAGQTEEQRGPMLAGLAGRLLAEAGYAVVARGQGSDAHITADVAVNPPERGRQVMTVIWRVTDGADRELGEVRQIVRLAEGALARPEPTLRRSVETALPGLVALAPPRG